MKNNNMTFDLDLLGRWLDDHGPDSIYKIAKVTGLSLPVMIKIKQKAYPSVPNAAARKQICELTGIPHHKLFPGS